MNNVIPLPEDPCAGGGGGYMVSPSGPRSNSSIPY